MTESVQREERTVPSVRAAVAIPAAGSGERMGGTRKQFLDLAGEPILLRTLRPFLRHGAVDAIVVALPPTVVESPPDWLAAEAPRLTVVAGGASRTASVRAAAEATPDDVEIVLVHDAVRPLVSGAIIDRCIARAAEGVGAVAAWPVADTIKEVDGDRRIVDTPDRSRLWAAQTPQAFPRGLLLDACRRAEEEGVSATDDAALVERYGGTTAVVEGAPFNMKITHPEDLVVAEALLTGGGGARR